MFPELVHVTLQIECCYDLQLVPDRHIGYEMVDTIKPVS
jgi:hypothetical protein